MNAVPIEICNTGGLVPWAGSYLKVMSEAGFAAMRLLLAFQAEQYNVRGRDT
jgi:hypothetical protein